MPDKPQDIRDLEERIKTAKMQRKMCEGQTQDAARNQSSLAIAFQIAVELVSGVLVGIGIGYILDEIFDFEFLFLLIFTIFGGAAGLLNVARYLKKHDKEEN